MADDDDDNYGTDVSHEEGVADIDRTLSQNKTASDDDDDKEDDSSAPAAPPESDADRKKRQITEDLGIDEGGNPQGGSQPLTSEEVFQHNMDLRQKAEQNNEKLMGQTEAARARYVQMLKQDQEDRASFDPQSGQQKTPTYEEYQMSHQQKQTWMGQLSQLLAVAVPIAMLFGLRGNGFAKGAMMNAMGSFLTNYSKGREQAAKQSFHDYQEQVKAIHESNKERIDLQKNILSNKRLSLEDQFKMTEQMSRYFMDMKGLQAAQSKDMNMLTKHLENKEKAAERFEKQTRAKKVPHPTDWENYVQEVKDYYRQKGQPIVDPDKSQEDEEQAAKDFKSYKQWSDEKHEKKLQEEKDLKESGKKKSRPKNWGEYAQWMRDHGYPDPDVDEEAAKKIKSYDQWSKDPSTGGSNEVEDPTAPMNEEKVKSLQQQMME